MNEAAGFDLPEYAPGGNALRGIPYGADIRGPGPFAHFSQRAPRLFMICARPFPWGFLRRCRSRPPNRLSPRGAAPPRPWPGRNRRPDNQDRGGAPGGPSRWFAAGLKCTDVN